jgi:asparagine synthase (glutamine-hydrolysing)
MGGFFLYKKNTSTSFLKKAHEEVFNGKGLKLNTKIETDGFIFSVYHKKYFENTNFVSFGENDFAAVTGTMIYDGKTGEESLKVVFRDFHEKKGIEFGLRGNFCLFIYKDSILYMIQDALGYYPVYCDEPMNFISSSFLAMAKSVKVKNISDHELYEYILSGQYVSSQTFIKEILFTDHKCMWKISPEISKINRKEISFVENRPDSLLFEESVELLSSVFNSIGSAFGNDITSALSGGYDTRLVFAIFRKIGIIPHLYVYGQEGSADVEIAKEIARGENLYLEHIDKRSLFIKRTPEEYMNLLESQFYSYDGSGSLGIFDDGTDMNTREQRIDKKNRHLLHINGAGGEIYREIWNIGNRNVMLDDFLKIRFERKDFNLCGKMFDRKRYMSVLKRKIKEIYGIKREYITRSELEWMFPYLRNRLAVINASVNNQLSYSLLPYMERDIVLQSYSIPFRLKNHGKFQSSLVKHFDSDLSKYPSQYGYNFYKGSGLKNIIKGKMLQLVPLSVRPMFRKVNKKYEPPYYLKKDYTNFIFENKKMILEDYINFDKITDKNIMSRALTAEILLRDLF